MTDRRAVGEQQGVRCQMPSQHAPTTNNCWSRPDIDIPQQPQLHNVSRHHHRGEHRSRNYAPNISSALLPPSAAVRAVADAIAPPDAQPTRRKKSSVASPYAKQKGKRIDDAPEDSSPVRRGGGTTPVGSRVTPPNHSPVAMMMRKGPTTGSCPVAVVRNPYAKKQSPRLIENPYSKRTIAIAPRETGHCLPVGGSPETKKPGAHCGMKRTATAGNRKCTITPTTPPSPGASRAHIAGGAAYLQEEISAIDHPFSVMAGTGTDNSGERMVSPGSADPPPTTSRCGSRDASSSRRSLAVDFDMEAPGEAEISPVHRGGGTSTRAARKLPSIAAGTGGSPTTGASPIRNPYARKRAPHPRDPCARMMAAALGDARIIGGDLAVVDSSPGGQSAPSRGTGWTATSSGGDIWCGNSAPSPSPCSAGPVPTADIGHGEVARPSGVRIAGAASLQEETLINSYTATTGPDFGEEKTVSPGMDPPPMTSEREGHNVTPSRRVLDADFHMEPPCEGGARNHGEGEGSVVRTSVGIGLMNPLMEEGLESRLPFHVQFELTRDRINNLKDKLMEPLGGRYEQTKSLYRELGKSSTSAIPYESAIRSDRAAGTAFDEGPGACLQYNAKLTQQGRLELQVPSPAHGARLYRKFGSHRFLFVRLPRNKMPNYERLMRHICRPGGNPLCLAGRQYGLLWVRYSESPQTYVFFAERGVGIGREDERSASGVSCWCIPPSLNADMTIGQKMKRIKLSFSTTISGGLLPDGCLERINDIVSLKRNYMTDGCGLISREAIDYVWKHYEANRRDRAGLMEQSPIGRASTRCPWSSFQGRVGGMKGLWVLDESLRGIKMQFRDSQRKYLLPMRSYVGFRAVCESLGVDVASCDYDECYDTVDVCSWDEIPRQDARLNLRFVQILESRGVGIDYFKRRVDDATEWLEQLFLDRCNLLKYIKDQANITDSADMFDDDLLFSLAVANVSHEEPIFRALLDDRLKMEITSMVEKAKYPVASARYLRLIPDHTGVLEEGEAFVALGGDSHLVQEGYIIAMRNPSFFKENLVKLKVVSASVLFGRLSKRKHGVSAYKFFENLKVGLVLSTKGDFSAAEAQSGGDFDGDSSWVCWDEELVAQVKDELMLDTTAPVFQPEKSAEENAPALVDGDATDQMIMFACNFVDHGINLGVVSNALDIAIDKCGVNSRASREIGLKGFLNVDHPFQLDQVRLTEGEVLAFSNGTVPHWYPKRQKNSQRYKSRKVLGQIYDHMEQKLCVLGSSAMDKARDNRLFMNPHVLKTIAQFEQRKPREVMCLRQRMLDLLRNYNCDFARTLEKYDGEFNKEERTAAIKDLKQGYRSNCIDYLGSVDERLITVAVLYEQSRLLSVQKGREYRFAWHIAHDYLTRIIADGENAENGVGVAATVGRNNRRVLYGRRTLARQKKV